MDFPIVHRMRIEHAKTIRPALPTRDEQRDERVRLAIANLPADDAFNALDAAENYPPSYSASRNAMRAVRRLLQQCAGRWFDLPGLMKRTPFARTTISTALQHLRNDPTMRLECKWQAGRHGGRSLYYRVPKRTEAVSA